MERVVLLTSLVGVVAGQQQAISYQNFRTSHGQGYPTYQSDGSWSQSFGGHRAGITTHPISFGARNAFNPYQHNIPSPSYPLDSHLYDSDTSLYDNPSFYDSNPNSPIFDSGPNPPIYNPVTNPIYNHANPIYNPVNPPVYDAGNPGLYEDPQIYTPDSSGQNYIPPPNIPTDTANFQPNIPIDTANFQQNIPIDTANFQQNIPIDTANFQPNIPIDTANFQPNGFENPAPQPYVPDPSGFVPTVNDYNPTTYPQNYDPSLVSTAEPQDYSPSIPPGTPDSDPTQNYPETDGTQNHSTYAPEAEQRNIEENASGHNYRSDGPYQNERSYQTHPNGGQGNYNNEPRNNQYDSSNAPNPTLSGPSRSDYSPRTDYRGDSTNYKSEVSQPTSRIESSSNFKKGSGPSKPYSADSFEGFGSSELGHSFETDEVMSGFPSSEGFSNENYGNFEARQASYESNDRPTSTSSFNSNHKTFDRNRPNFEPQDKYNKNINYKPQRRFETDVSDSSSKEGVYNPKELKQRSLERPKGTGGHQGVKKDTFPGSRSSDKKGLVKEEGRIVYLEKKLAQEAEKLAPSEIKVEKAFVKRVPFEVRTPHNKSKKNVQNKNFD